MNINDSREERLFLNAGKFFWGIFRMNQKEVYPYLERKYRLQFKRGSYRSVELDLIQRYGIAHLLNIVRQEIYAQLGDETVGTLKYHWYKCEFPPPMDELRRLSNDLQFAGLVDIKTLDLQGEIHRYVNGWGTFAPTFFEVIDPRPEMPNKSETIMARL